MRSIALLSLLVAATAPAQTALTQPSPPRAPLLLTGMRVLAPDGESFLEGRAVLVEDGRIAAVAALEDLAASYQARTLDLTGHWLVPGLIDLHSHVTLHPYDETSWNDQVLKESLELRTIRATAAAQATLLAGFTTLRDLGTEGAGFADVALRDAIGQGIVPGPRIFAATRALVATGCYGPSGFDPRWQVPKGAQVADGPTGVRIAVREQIAAGADWIKVYADYRRRPGDDSTPTYSQAELEAICDEAHSAGLPVAAHAVTDVAILRSVRAGVKTIEHGYQASAETLFLMAERGVALCPTLAANEAIVRYSGARGPIVERLNTARITFQRALKAGVTIACGSDVGVFAHGRNLRELELMVRYGMTPAQALRSATVIAADILGKGGELGAIAPGHAADLVAVRGNPHEQIEALGQPRLVVKGGAVVIEPTR